MTKNEIENLIYESRDVGIGRQRLQDMARNGDRVSRLAWCAIADVAYTHAKNLEKAAEQHGISLQLKNDDSLLPILYDRATDHCGQRPRCLIQDRAQDRTPSLLF